MADEKNKINKIYDGRMMSCICLQYIQDNYDLDCIELGIITKIIRYTFGFKKRNAFINQNIFKLSKNTLKKYRDMLVQKGILKWQKTRKYTIYEIIEPNNEIEKFVLKDGCNVVHQNKKELEIDLSVW